MKKAAIYCRVSTEDQEREGTSLETQKESCLAKAKELVYEVAEELDILPCRIHEVFDLWEVEGLVKRF